jgi:hypothetical protein
VRPSFLLKVVMNLALVGEDASARRLVEAALESGRWSLAWRSETRSMTTDQQAPERDDWESVADFTADVVVLSSADRVERRADQLRLLAQAGATVAVANAETLGQITCYEMDMIRAASEARIVADVVERLHPAIARLQTLIGDGDSPNRADRDWLGPVEQVTITRGIADRGAANVLARLARDIDLVRALGGDVTRLSAVGAAASTERAHGDAEPHARDFTGLNVHLTTQRFPAQWSIDRDIPDGAGRLVIYAARGRAALTIDGPQWTLTVSQAAQGTADAPDRGGDFVHATPLPDVATALPEIVETFEPWRPEIAWLEQIEATERGEPIAPDWLDIARAVDAADMVEVSLRRGRTVDLYNEAYTEQGTFKGVMGIAGCGLLLLALFVLLAAAVGQKAARLAGFDGLAALLGHWHYALLALLVVFLVLQLFSFAAPRPSRQARRE